MSILQAIILAIIEGITEYLPVSSTGHMIIASSFMGIAEKDFTKLFTVVIQLGAIMAVMVLYWKRFFQSIDFYLKLLVAFIPAAFLGVLLGDYIDELLENPVVVAVSLLIGGFILIKIGDWFNKPDDNQTITYKRAFIIGLFQCIAMIPGASRSASTIIGGMTQKLTRTNAAEFSFFLAVPTMLGATVKKILDYYVKDYIKVTNHFNMDELLQHINQKITTDEVIILGIGNVMAFIVALVAIKSFILFLSKKGFKIFGYYRIIVGIILLAIHLFIHPLTTF